MGIFKKIHQHLAADPEIQEPEEIMQSIEQLEITEQLRIVQTVKDYMEAYMVHSVKLLPSWIKGYGMLNEMFISKGDQTLMRCNVEAFYQDPNTGIRELVYLVSLVKFENTKWYVFQIKEARHRNQPL